MTNITSITAAMITRLMTTDSAVIAGLHETQSLFVFCPANQFTGTEVLQSYSLPLQTSTLSDSSYFLIRYDTIEEFNVDSKAEYSALSSTRSQKKRN